MNIILHKYWVLFEKKSLKLGKLLFYVKLFCLGFATKMPIF